MLLWHDAKYQQVVFIEFIFKDYLWLIQSKKNNK